MRHNIPSANRSITWKFASIFITSIALLGTLAVASPAGAIVQQTNQNCVLATHGIDETGNFIWGPEDFQCYSTFADVVRAIGAGDVPDGTLPSDVGVDVALADFVIGIHYDGANGGTPSMTVTGSVCGGGGLNVPTSFNDRISSTYNGCNTITHYENGGYVGSSFSTFGVGNLTNITGYMDNRTTSIKYFS